MPFCGQTETQMNSYKRWNNIVGWIVFAIAAMTYLLTMEPSSSLWDCSEFIATSYKLEVGHPPGAPLFMLLARLATILAPSTYYVPHMVNAMNCLASAFCILFLFWTITHLARRILTRQGAELTKANIVAVLGTGAVGALAYTFTDTFWFSAVEGEVYALSSMFTALVVWLMLKWEEQADQPHSMRWIVLIAYLMGLSIGVHILNLLTIPALVFIYYFRKTQRITFKGIAVSTLISGAILVFINSIIIPHTVYIGALFDLFFVNSLGLPVNSGLVFFVVALLGALGMGVYFTHKKGRTVLNLVLLSTLMILIGYSSYASVTIRAAANPPIEQQQPEQSVRPLFAAQPRSVRRQTAALRSPVLGPDLRLQIQGCPLPGRRRQVQNGFDHLRVRTPRRVHASVPPYVELRCQQGELQIMERLPHPDRLRTG